MHHLALVSDWEAAQRSGDYRISTLGRTLEEEGFIHASFADQVDGTARRFYGDVGEPLVLLAVDITRVRCEVKLEAPPGAPDAFPHLYGPIPLDAVVGVTPYQVPPADAAWARLHHAHLFASDLDATLAFWRRWFGARVVADVTVLGSRNVMVAVGDGRLNIYDQPPRDHGRNAVHHLGVQVKDVAALADRLVAGGVGLRKPVQWGEGFSYVMVEAPDGVLLEVFEAGDSARLAPSVPWFSWA